MSDDPLETVRREMKKFRELVSVRGAIGSLDVTSTRWPSVGRDMDALFPSGGTDFSAAVARFSELGLSHLLGPNAVQYLGKEEEQIAAALGVKHCTARRFDPKENEAFFLACFAELHLDITRQWPLADVPLEGSGRLPQISPPFFNAVLRLGRLLEWWRWRHLDLDQRAAERKRTSRHSRTSASTISGS